MKLERPVRKHEGRTPSTRSSCQGSEDVQVADGEVMAVMVMVSIANMSQQRHSFYHGPGKNEIWGPT